MSFVDALYRILADKLVNLVLAKVVWLEVAVRDIHMDIRGSRASKDK